MRSLCLALAAGALMSLCACASTTPLPSSSSSIQPEPAQSRTWRTGYEWFEPKTDTEVTLVSGYRHVLTTEPRTVYTAPEEPAVAEPSPGEPTPKEEPAKGPAIEPSQPQSQPAPASPVVASATVPPAQPSPPSAVRPESKMTAFERAWRRFCANGEGMTDDDWKVIFQTGGEIPERFRKGCVPPK